MGKRGLGHPTPHIRGRCETCMECKKIRAEVEIRYGIERHIACIKKTRISKSICFRVNIMAIISMVNVIDGLI